MVFRILFRSIHAFCVLAIGPFRSLARPALLGGSATHVRVSMAGIFKLPPRFVQLALVAVAFKPTP